MGTLIECHHSNVAATMPLACGDRSAHIATSRARFPTSSPPGSLHQLARNVRAANFPSKSPHTGSTEPPSTCSRQFCREGGHTASLETPSTGVRSACIFCGAGQNFGAAQTNDTLDDHSAAPAHCCVVVGCIMGDTGSHRRGSATIVACHCVLRISDVNSAVPRLFKPCLQDDGRVPQRRHRRWTQDEVQHGTENRSQYASSTSLHLLLTRVNTELRCLSYCGC